MYAFSFVFSNLSTTDKYTAFITYFALFVLLINLLLHTTHLSVIRHAEAPIIKLNTPSRNYEYEKHKEDQFLLQIRLVSFKVYVEHLEPYFQRFNITYTYPLSSISFWYQKGQCLCFLRKLKFLQNYYFYFAVIKKF